MKKRRLLIPILLLCLTLLVSCGAKPEKSEEQDTEALLTELYGDNTAVAVEGQKRDNVFTLNYVPVRSMNPITGQSAENSVLEALIYEGLFTLNDKFEPENVLCSSYSTADGKTYVFDILPGVKFSDGTPLTAFDVQYTIDYARELDRYSQRLTNIEETAVENDRFIVTLYAEDRSFPCLLDIPIISQGSIDNERPVGTGRYVISESDDGAKLEKNPYFRDPASVPLDTIYLAAFSPATLNESFVDGSLDLVWIDPCDGASVALGGNHDERPCNTTLFQYVGFDAYNTLLADRNVRSAIALSVDRTLAVREMDGFGLKAPLIFSRAWNYYDNSLEPEEAADRAFLASEYLKKAGMKDFDGDGWLDWEDESTESGYYCYIDFVITVHADSRQKKLVAHDMASFLNGIGLKTTVNELPWKEYCEAIETGGFDIFLAEVKLPASFDFTDILASGGRLNYGDLSDEDLDDLLAACRRAEGEEKRAAASELAAFMRDESYIVPILYRQFAVHTQRNTVYDLVTSPSSIFYNFPDWKIDLD